MRVKEKIIHAKEVHTGLKKLHNVTLRIKDDEIVSIDDKGYNYKKAVSLIIPTFIDLQVYGSLGKLFSSYPDVKTLEIMEKHHQKNGTFFFQPTIASSSYEVIYKCIEAVKKHKEKNLNTGCIGLHIEGPWLNTEKRGAHKKEFLHRPNENQIDSIINFSEGFVSLITLAPEMVKESYIKKLKKNGIVISIGHSNCNYSKTNFLSKKMIRLATHLFNAMPNIHHRKLNLTTAILTNNSIFCSIIPDGYHVDFQLIKLAYKLKKNKLFCITDSVTENNKGLYKHKKNNNYFTNNGILSGSSISMAESFKNLVQKVELTIDQSVEMCCITPHKVLTNRNLAYKIEIGAKARFNILNEKLNLIKAYY